VANKKAQKQISELQKKVKKVCEKLDTCIQSNGSSEELKKKSRLVTEKVKKLAESKPE